VNIYPIFLDTRPRYLEGSQSPASLLLLPVGAGTLLEHLHSRVAEVTDAPPVIFAGFEASTSYQAEIRRADSAILSVFGPAGLAAHLDTYEPSDCLLVVDPACFPAAGLDVRLLLKDGGSDPRWARHLVALDFSPDGTRECVEFDRDGLVRRIQRFYDGVTWPFTAGVCCSLLPGSCARLGDDLPWTSLARLRQALTSRGIPARDVPLQSAALDLAEERGALAASDRLVREALEGRKGSRGDGVLYAGARQQIHRSARLLGPIVIQADAVIEEDATILGPALIGEGARVGRGALVAQSLVGRGTVIPAGGSLRHRVLVGEVSALSEDAPWAPPAAMETSGDGALRDGYPAVYARCKPVLDSAAALLALVLLSPLLLVVAALIKLDSRGAVFYGHRREGKDGRVFRCWKFRTMHAGAEMRERELQARNQVDGPQFKLEHDPRTTRVGRWLRPTSLDELPQLVNVVLGEMSFVGPRPSPFRENQLCVPWRDGRLSVRPGITGLWQVCRHDRRAGDFHQWIHYDLLYVRNLCLRLDLNILAATVLTLGGKGHVSLSWVMPSPRLQEEM
jgi:lipopolysaccharide/colanic/teichoic acid biosynthesis glycosyltransferase